jgi:hypothetical protein
MKLRDPRYRYAGIINKRRIPESDLERSLFVLLHGAEELTALTPQRPWSANTIVDPSVAYPYDIFKVDATRIVLEAFLLATEEDNEISSALSMPADEVSAYRHLFFDTTIFKTDLDIIVYLQSIPDDSPYKGLYKIAFHQGIAALRWHFCRDKGHVEPGDVVRTLMTDTFFRSLEHRGQSITSKAAKEAAKMASTALLCAKTLLQEATTSESDIESLRMKFEEIRSSRTIQDLAKSGIEVIH